MTLARAWIKTTQSGVKCTNYEATSPPHLSYYGASKFSRFLFLHIDFSSHLIKKPSNWNGMAMDSLQSYSNNASDLVNLCPVGKIKCTQTRTLTWFSMVRTSFLICFAVFQFLLCSKILQWYCISLNKHLQKFQPKGRPLNWFKCLSRNY